jgi:hypothetical protein
VDFLVPRPTTDPVPRHHGHGHGGHGEAAAAVDAGQGAAGARGATAWGRWNQQFFGVDIPLLGGGLEYFLSFHSIWDNPSQLTTVMAIYQL